MKTIPGIIGELGEGIAEAQKQLDANYIRSLEQLGVIARAFVGQGVDQGKALDFMRHLVETAAPARYQFTETSLHVRLDLSEARDTAVSGSAGGGFAGIVVSGSFATRGSPDYRAGAEVRCTLHAVLPQDNRAAFGNLLDRAKELDNSKLELAGRSEHDKDVLDAMRDAAKAAGADPKAIDTK
ncbi:MAG: hypothetical protein FJW40_22195 [Acidobacteria bacterium]|nr:hypothetical protein [Acidobacteriota bacterium]